MTDLLTADNISVKLDGRDVLCDASMAIRAGRTTAIVGPNGAGKTTLLKVLNAAVSPARGAVRIENRLITEMSRGEIARRIAVVAQENETKFPVSVLDFVLGGRFARGRVFGWDTESDLSAANKAIEACDLTRLRMRQMNSLSGGERQRVVFARALAAETDILLLDEPTANLDLAHQADMFRLVASECREGSRAAAIVTHDLNLAAAFADKILMLNAGKPYAYGDPEAVLTNASIREVFDVNTVIDRGVRSGRLRVTVDF